MSGLTRGLRLHHNRFPTKAYLVAGAQLFPFLGFHRAVHRHPALFDVDVCFAAGTDEVHDFEQVGQGNMVVSGQTKFEHV